MNRRAVAASLLSWTLAVTLLRAIRLPNDFAQAHWLLGYRYGLLKRGLVGQIVWDAGRPVGLRPGETAITVLSGVIFAAFLAALFVVSLRVISRSRWSAPSIMIATAFLSSPFIVMSGHFFGYFDSLVIVLAIVSTALVLRGHVWGAAVLQTVAVLVHESSVAVGLPVVLFAWLLRRPQPDDTRRVPWWPLMMPLLALAVLVANERFWLSPHVEGWLAAYLSHFPFVQGDMHQLVPSWLLTGSVENLGQLRHLGTRLSSGHMHGLVLPTTLAIASYLVEAARPLRTRTAVALFVVCGAPLAMHAVAWDTARIWTMVIAVSYLALWVSVETAPPGGAVPVSVSLIAMVALTTSVIAVSPLMDGLNERLPLGVRLLLYAPVFVGCGFLIRQPAAPSPESHRRDDGGTSPLIRK